MSILNDSLYRKHFSGYPLHPPEGTSSTYDSSEIPLEGMVHLPVTYQSDTIQNFPFYVTRNSSSLMGLGFQVSMNGVIIQSVDIVSAFLSVFTGFGKIAKFVHRPRVKPEVTPVSQGLRRLPFSVREEVSREKDEPCKSMTDDYVMEVELDNLVTPLELKAASSTDITLMQVRHFIQNGWPRHPPAGLETYCCVR